MDEREKKLIGEVLDIVDCVEKGYFFLKRKCKLKDYVKGIQLTHKKLGKLLKSTNFKQIKPGIAKWSKMVLGEVVALERSLKKVLPSRDKAIAVSKGVIKVIHRLMAKVKLKGIKAKGQKFNPKLHHAVRLCKSPKLPNKIVVKVYSRGYIMNGKLFKAARVLVNQRTSTPSAKRIKANKDEYKGYMKKVGFFGEMFGVKDGEKQYGDYMKIQDYYKDRVESKYSLDKFMPSS